MIVSNPLDRFLACSKLSSQEKISTKISQKIGKKREYYESY